MDIVLLKERVLELPIIQGIAPYLNIKDLLILRLVSKSFYSVVSSGEMKLCQTIQFEHSVREEVLAFIACIASKKIKFCKPLDATFVHNILTMSQNLSELVMMNDDIPEGYQYPKHTTFSGSGDFSFQNFGAFRNVTHLRIESFVDNNSLIRLLNSENLPHLCKLKMHSSNIRVKVIQAISKMSNLERLTIIGNNKSGYITKITSECAYVLGSLLVNMKNLKRLHLRRVGLNNEQLERFILGIKTSGKSLSIQCLKLDGNCLGYFIPITPITEKFIEIGTYMPLLEILHIGNCSLEHNSATIIAAVIRNIRNLKRITLGSNSFGPYGIKEILDDMPSTLEELYLHGCSDEKANNHIFCDSLIRYMSINTRLWGLGLNGNNLDGNDIYNIVKSMPPTIRDIGITNEDLKDEYMKLIGSTIAERCPRIRYVFLYTTGFKGAKYITSDGLVSLQKELARTSGLLVSENKLSRYIKHA